MLLILSLLHELDQDMSLLTAVNGTIYPFLLMVEKKCKQLPSTPLLD